MLADTLLPFCDENYKNGCRFQQDNSSAHSEADASEWFMQESVATIEWPPRIPDLNPAENLWAIQSNAAYSDFKQYNTIDDLKELVLYERERIPIETLRKLSGSMVRRSLTRWRYQVLISIIIVFRREECAHPRMFRPKKGGTFIHNSSARFSLCVAFCS